MCRLKIPWIGDIFIYTEISDLGRKKKNLLSNTFSTLHFIQCCMHIQVMNGWLDSGNNMEAFLSQCIHSQHRHHIKITLIFSQTTLEINPRRKDKPVQYSISLFQISMLEVSPGKRENGIKIHSHLKFKV